MATFSAPDVGWAHGTEYSIQRGERKIQLGRRAVPESHRENVLSPAFYVRLLHSSNTLSCALWERVKFMVTASAPLIWQPEFCFHRGLKGTTNNEADMEFLHLS